MWRGLLATGAAASATACAAFTGSEDLSLPVSAPEAWRSQDTSDIAPKGDWVGSFNDARLRQLVAEAVSANYDIAVAASRLDQARERARIAGADRLPTLNADFSYNRTEITQEAGQRTVVDPDTGIPVTVNSDPVTENYNLGLSASWELDLWRRLAAAAKAGVLDAAAAEADLVDARLSIAAAVSRAWFNLTEARLLVALAADEVASQERSVELTERRFKAGLAESLDVRLARSALASSRANEAARRNALNNAARVLEVLLGRYPAAELQAAGSLPKLPTLSGVGAPGDLLARRPDLRAAEARVEAAGLRARQARRAVLPRLSLTASYGTRTAALEDVFDPDALVSNLVTNLTAPLFNAGALGADARRAQDVARETLSAYASAALTAFREAEDALDAEYFLELQENALALAVEEAIAAEELAERQYSSGVGTIFELLDAQRRRISAEQQHITVRRNRVVNRVDLYLAIGGDFRVTAPGNVEEEPEDHPI